MTDPPNGTLPYRVSDLERRVKRIEDYEPAVIKSELRGIDEDVKGIKADVASLRKVLIGFMVSFTGVAVATTVAIVVFLGSGG